MFYRGLFWLVDGELAAVRLPCDEEGNFLGEVPVSLTGKMNVTHSVEWEKMPKHFTRGKPYHYYPRGRVEIQRGKVRIFLHPDLATPEVLPRIRAAFGLTDCPDVAVIADGSAHYQYLQGGRLGGST